MLLEHVPSLLCPVWSYLSTDKLQTWRVKTYWCVKLIKDVVFLEFKLCSECLIDRNLTKTRAEMC